MKFHYSCLWFDGKSSSQICNKFEIQFKFNTNYVERSYWRSIDILEIGNYDKWRLLVNGKFVYFHMNAVNPMEGEWELYQKLYVELTDVVCLLLIDSTDPLSKYLIIWPKLDGNYYIQVRAKEEKNTNIHNLFRLLHARTTIVNSVFFCLSFFPEFVPHQPSDQQEKWQETKEEQLIEMRYYLSLIQQQRMHSICIYCLHASCLQNLT